MSSSDPRGDLLTEELLYLLNELRALNTPDELSSDRKRIKQRLAIMASYVDQVISPIDVLAVCRETLSNPVQS